MDFETFVRIPFVDELATLPEVYETARELDTHELGDWLLHQSDSPLLVVASGGSMTAAAMAVDLHQRATGHLAKSASPTEIWTYGTEPTCAAGLVLSAGGANADAMAIARLLVHSRGTWAVLTGQAAPPMIEKLTETSIACFAYDLLPKVHGWVPVGATLSQALVLATAYSAAFPGLGSVPGSIASLLPAGANTVIRAVDALAEQLETVLTSERLLCLFTPTTAALATDIEAKFAEGGLGFLQLSDLRNFAHGRYQTVLANPEGCAILLVYSEAEERYVRRYASLLPVEVPLGLLALPAPSAIHAQLASVVTSLALVGAVGRVRDIEPGWGSVCEFGDALYELALPDVVHQNCPTSEP